MSESPRQDSALPSRPDNSSAADPDGDYIVVARRYRPQTFADLIGQQHVAKALEGAITTNRVGHAYLFTGARGVGKTSAARILAKALDCAEGPAPEPCNKCEICDSISSGEDVDVLEIDGASNRGIDEIRQLRSNVNIRPSRARFKIYIIDEVHMLTREAFNALLKTLEEPPEHVKFIFCTTEPNKIPITVLSRCQRFDFAGIQAASIVKRLEQIVAAEGVTADEQALQLLARRAAGSMRDSQSLLEQLLSFGSEHITAATVHSMLGTADGARLIAMARQLAANDAAGALAGLDGAIMEGVDVGQLINQLMGVFRDCMVTQAGCDADTLIHSISDDEQAALREVAEQLSLERTLAVLQILEQAEAGMRYTTHRRTLAEVALVRACRLEGLDELSSLVAELRDGGSLATGKGLQRLPASRPSPAPSSKKKPERARPPRDTTSAPAQSVVAPATSPAEPALPQSEPAVDDRDAPSLPAGQPLTEESAKHVWEQALARLTGMVTAKAREYNQLAAPEPNRLIVTFNQTYTLCKSYCERPEHARRIEQALEEVTGTRVHVVFALSDEAERESAPPKQRPVSRHKKLAEASENAMVQQAQKLFGARPVDVKDN